MNYWVDGPTGNKFEGWQGRFGRQLRRRRVRRLTVCVLWKEVKISKNLHNLLDQHVEYPKFTVFGDRNRMFFP